MKIETRIKIFKEMKNNGIKSKDNAFWLRIYNKKFHDKCKLYKLTKRKSLVDHKRYGRRLECLDQEA